MKCDVCGKTLSDDPSDLRKRTQYCNGYHIGEIRIGKKNTLGGWI